MKHLANIITLIRIILSFILFYLINNTLLFVSLYIICGLTDALDGYIARKTNTQSVLGAKLDSIADLLFTFLIIFSCIILMNGNIMSYIPYLIAITVIRLLNLILAAYKYHQFAILHTLGNKFTGFLCFLSPIFILLGYNQIILLVCIIAFVSAIEETAIHIISKTLDINKQSIFIKNNI